MVPDIAPGPDEEPVAAARFVRPYTITAGRTKSAVDLPVEATLRQQPALPGAVADLAAGAQRVLSLCDQKSVAEVSALTSMPIGVVRVLLGDLVEQGPRPGAGDHHRELVEGRAHRAHREDPPWTSQLLAGPAGRPRRRRS